MAGTEVVSELAGGQNIIVYAVIQAMTFVAGVLVLLQGVRMFLGEIIPAFKGISEKLIPGARPALDVPIFYASGPVYNSRFPLRDGRRDSCNFDFNSVESCRITGSDRIVFHGRRCRSIWR